jgi:carbamoyl-phosphate synthase large subunit
MAEKILLTGAGGPAAISVWKSLAKEHALYMGDMDPCAAGLYLVPAERRFIWPRGDAADFVDIVLDICKTHGIEVLIPTVDAELAPLSAAAEKFSKIGVQLPISSFEALQLCRDKYELLKFCENQIPIPKTQLYTSEIIDRIAHFPLLAKPRKGSGSRGIFNIEKSEGLMNLPQDGSYLLQELLTGDEYSVDVYMHSSGRPIAAVPRLRMKLKGGVAVTARTQHFPELSTLAIKIAALVKLRYAVNIQFKADKTRQFKLLEINPRFPGTLPLTTAAGVDMPKLLMQDLQQHEFATGLMPFKELLMVRYWTEHFCSPDEWEELCQR